MVRRSAERSMVELQSVDVTDALWDYESHKELLKTYVVLEVSLYLHLSICKAQTRTTLRVVGNVNHLGSCIMWDFSWPISHVFFYTETHICAGPTSFLFCEEREIGTLSIRFLCPVLDIYFRMRWCPRSDYVFPWTKKAHCND